MEEKKSVKPHCIMWNDRKKGSATGVTDMLFFDENSIVLQTEQGMLTVKGRDLHIGRLMLDQGEVEMEGCMDSLTYSGSNPAKKGAVMKRLFR